VSHAWKIVVVTCCIYFSLLFNPNYSHFLHNRPKLCGNRINLRSLFATLELSALYLRDKC